MDEFRRAVLETVDAVLASFEKEMLFKVVKPLINLARPELETMVEERPEEIYLWLKVVVENAQKGIEIYEKGKK